MMPTNAELAKSVDALQSEVDELKKSLTMFNALYEEMKSSQATLTKENKDLSRANAQLSICVSELEQYSRLNNVEIKGVPLTKGESCVEIVKTIGEKVGCPVSESDLDVVHRVPAEEGQNIIARFCSRTKKAEFAAVAKKARLTGSAIRLTAQTDSNKPVYINDHLTPEKRLFAQALDLKKEKQWKFLWVDNCRIKARKTTDSTVYRIAKAADLALIN